MSKAFTCRDIGLECEWSVSAETEGELLLLIGEHMAQINEIGDPPLPPPMASRPLPIEVAS